MRRMSLPLAGRDQGVGVVPRLPRSLILRHPHLQLLPARGRRDSQSVRMAKPASSPSAPKPSAPAPKPPTARFALPRSGPLAKALEALKRGDSPTLARVPEGFDALVVADLARALSQGFEGPAVLVHVA